MWKKISVDALKGGDEFKFAEDGQVFVALRLMNDDTNMYYIFSDSTLDMIILNEVWVEYPDPYWPDLKNGTVFRFVGGVSEFYKAGSRIMSMNGELKEEPKDRAVEVLYEVLD